MGLVCIWHDLIWCAVIWWDILRCDLTLVVVCYVRMQARTNHLCGACRREVYVTCAHTHGVYAHVAHARSERGRLKGRQRVFDLTAPLERDSRNNSAGHECRSRGAEAQVGRRTQGVCRCAQGVCRCTQGSAAFGQHSIDYLCGNARDHAVRHTTSNRIDLAHDDEHSTLMRGTYGHHKRGTPHKFHARLYSIHRLRSWTD